VGKGKDDRIWGVGYGTGGSFHGIVIAWVKEDRAEEG